MVDSCTAIDARKVQTVMVVRRYGRADLRTGLDRDMTQRPTRSRPTIGRIFEDILICQ